MGTKRTKYFEEYGKANRKKFHYQQTPADERLVCHKKGCHSCRHKQIHVPLFLTGI